MNFWVCGMSFQQWCWSRMSKILSSGDSLVMANQQNLLMQHFFRGQLPSILGGGFGNLGHMKSAISSCHWLLETDVGQLIDLQDVAFSILLLAPIVIRTRKTLTTCCCDGCLLKNSGSPSCKGLVCSTSVLKWKMFVLMTGGIEFPVGWLILFKRALFPCYSR
jgi:hypothetical protein